MALRAGCGKRVLILEVSAVGVGSEDDATTPTPGRGKKKRRRRKGEKGHAGREARWIDHAPSGGASSSLSAPATAVPLDEDRHPAARYSLDMDGEDADEDAWIPLAPLPPAAQR